MPTTFFISIRIQEWNLKKNRSADQGQEVYSEATFFVEDPQNLEAVMKRVKEQVDLSNLIVSLDDSAYQASVKPLRQIGIYLHGYFLFLVFWAVLQYSVFF